MIDIFFVTVLLRVTLWLSQSNVWRTIVVKLLLWWVLVYSRDPCYDPLRFFLVILRLRGCVIGGCWRNVRAANAAKCATECKPGVLTRCLHRVCYAIDATTLRKPDSANERRNRDPNGSGQQSSKACHSHACQDIVRWHDRSRRRNGRNCKLPSKCVVGGSCMPSLHTLTTNRLETIHNCHCKNSGTINTIYIRAHM